ncbi:hypothetical protein KKF91_13585 [Myxococcota bacterium]|nr:hypothetical protein [Myxococcota bacterium]MBU1431569.1 hypothetical protein [Myxococcota bacterium]MBU1900498.1 hypothetical protein [Myxococcota bacterium]
MAQLKVGEIQIADGQIHIGATEIGGPAVEARPSASRPRDQLPAPLRRLRGELLIGGGIGAVALGGALFMTLPLEGLARYLFGGALIPFGIGVAALGALKLRQDRVAGRATRAVADERHARLGEIMLAVVEGSDGQRAVEDLAVAAGLPLEDAIRGLAHLQRAGRIEEKLNLETGDWYYAALEVEPAYGSGSLAERMAALEEDR